MAPPSGTDCGPMIASARHGPPFGAVSARACSSQSTRPPRAEVLRHSHARLPRLSRSHRLHVTGRRAFWSHEHKPGRRHTRATTDVLARRCLVANRGLLRIEEAAQWPGPGRTKAYELVHRGTLRRVCIGRSRRVPVSALEAFVEQLVEDGAAP